MSFGGTKNGLLGAEAVVVFADELKGRIPFVRKQFMQLGSKSRFLAAQFLALFTDDLWRRSARQANGMAERLRTGLAGVDGVVITQRCQANAVFATLPRALGGTVAGGGPVLRVGRADDEVRLMCSWDTPQGLVDEFVSAARRQATSPEAPSVASQGQA